MEKLFDHKDTIAAPSTPPGAGAIAVVRVSGADAFSVCDRLFRGKKITEQPSHTIAFGRLFDDEGMIDEVVVTVFRAPRSFTGEDTAEISCHGSDYIVRRILNALFKQGARPAKPGEFTMRAFLNGRLDLAQAEAVADLIASESKASHEIALKQMRGGFSDELQNLRSQLIDFAALIELELDFSEEDIAFADREKFTELLNRIQTIISALIRSFEYGNVIKEGVGVAIMGKPNAGKSSLLNALLNEERAIVSDIPGTTRDSIEETLTVEGILFRFIDTAGLRQTDDVIESIGIRKAREKAEQAKIILYLFDKSDGTPEEVSEEVRRLYREDIILILVQAKADITGDLQEEDEFIKALQSISPRPVRAVTAVSVYRPETIDDLKALLASNIRETAPAVGSIVTNSRHLEALQKAQEHLAAVRLGMERQLGNDLLAHDIHFALRYLGEITGSEIDVDRDILGTIFGRFCIGK